MASRNIPPEGGGSPPLTGEKKNGSRHVSQLMQLFEPDKRDTKTPPPVKTKPQVKKPDPFRRARVESSEEVTQTSTGASQEVPKVQELKEDKESTSLNNPEDTTTSSSTVPDIKFETTEMAGPTQDGPYTSLDTAPVDDSHTTIAEAENEHQGSKPTAKVVLRHLTTEKTSSEVKKRSEIIEETDHVSDKVQQEQEADQSETSPTLQSSERRSLQRQEEVTDNSGLIDSGKGDSLNGEPLENDVPDEPIYIDYEDMVDRGPTKFEEGFDKILGSDRQEDETFQKWLERMRAANSWNTECPASLEQASKIDTLKITELKQLGKAFNEIIMERLKKAPESELQQMVKEPIHLFIGSENKDDFKKRIQMACKSFHGVNRDLNAIGDILETKQIKEKEVRVELKKCLLRFEATLNELGPDLVKLLAIGDDTSEGLETHKTLLDDDQCPIVVAGQVSSGKSSLLNLFLGAGGKKKQDVSSSGTAVLPVSVLACTGRICEISYGDLRTAVIKHDKTGEIKKIDVDNIAEHVDMHEKDSSYKDEERINDIVQLGLPIPFLKGGITLVDTPGVGENQIDSEVVKNYIQAHNVFGFIFTIHTSAGSGVNIKFQQLLTELSTYRNENGHKKLDPQSVIFVCNFWDQVPEKDRQETKLRVLTILKETGFLQHFDPEKQLFFMNSKGAFETWNVGFVSEDYDRLIGGMERFFEIGHKRKIMHSYVWFNALVQRVMRSMKFVQVWARDIGAGSTRRIFKELEGKLDTIEKQYRGKVKRLKDQLPKAAAFLAERLSMDILKGTKPDLAITDVHYLETLKENPDLQEYKLDEIIDTRINCFLSAWEAKNHIIYRVKLKIVELITKQTDAYDTRLDEFERQSLSMEKCNETPGSPFAKGASVKAGHVLEDIKMGSLEDTNMDISFGRTYGDEIMKGTSISKRESLAGDCVIKNFAKRSKTMGRFAQTQKNRLVGSFHQHFDYKRYCRYRAGVIFDEMCEKKSLKHIMMLYLKPVENLIDNIHSTTKVRIEQNRALISTIDHSIMTVMGTIEQRAHFFASIDKMNGVFNRLLELGYETGVEEVKFNRENLCIKTGSENKATTTCGVLVPAVMDEAPVLGEDGGSMSQGCATVRLMKGYLTESEQLELVKHLGKLSKEVRPRCAPVVLGLCENGYGVVLGGQLMTTRQYFFSLTKDEATYRQRVVNFVQTLADVLSFVHSKDLVTAELSLDTVVLQIMETDKIGPMFTNIREKGPVRLPDGQSPTGNYIYLPNEVVKASELDTVDGWYSSAGDMYGLGVMILELFHQVDFLKRLKSDTFERWSNKTELGRFIITEYQRKASSNKVPADGLDICRKCLSEQPKERPTAEAFRRDWDSKIRSKYIIEKSDLDKG